MQEVSVLDITNRDSMDLDKDSVQAPRRTPVQEFNTTEEDLPEKPPETANNSNRNDEEAVKEED